MVQPSAAAEARLAFKHELRPAIEVVHEAKDFRRGLEEYQTSLNNVAETPHPEMIRQASTYLIRSQIERNQRRQNGESEQNSENFGQLNDYIRRN